jgi:hypothetical protein
VTPVRYTAHCGAVLSLKPLCRIVNFRVKRYNLSALLSQIETYDRWWPAKGAGRRVHGSGAAQEGTALTAEHLAQVGGWVMER